VDLSKLLLLLIIVILIERLLNLLEFVVELLGIDGIEYLTGELLSMFYNLIPLFPALAILKHGAVIAVINHQILSAELFLPVELHLVLLLRLVLSSLFFDFSCCLEVLLIEF
jgi:hypothetical protein